MSWFPCRMVRADILVANHHRDRMLSTLNAEGLVELRDVKRDEVDGKELLDRPQTHSSLAELEETCSRLSKAIQVMSRTVPPWKGGIGSLFTPKPDNRIEVRPLLPRAVMDGASKLLKSIEGPLLEAEKSYEELEQKIESLKARYHSVSLMQDLGVDLSLLTRSGFTFVTVGTTPDPEKIREAISPFNAIMDSALAGKAQHVALVLGLRREEAKLMPLLRNAGFYPMVLGRAAGRPKEEMARMEAVLKKLEKAREEVLDTVRKIKDSVFLRTYALREEVEIEIEKASAVQKLGCTESAHLISTWCPKKAVKRLEGLVEKATENTGALYIAEPEEGEKPPSLMANPRWSRPFQSLTEMYGTPGYMEIDPTKIIAPVFILFFGLMLGDVFYGLIMTITAVFLYRGSKKYGDGLRSFNLILICAGLSTIFFGLIQGGYLGPVMVDAGGSATYPNLVQLFGLAPSAPLNAMEDPISLLVIALLVGLAYINVALFLGAVQNIKRREYKEILFQQLPWWLLQPASFVLLGAGLFGWWTFSSQVELVAWVFTLFGLLLLFVDKKGLFFFEITGFIGNFLSFARLLALGLATAGIALTINVIITLISHVTLDLGVASFPVFGAGIALLAVGMYKHNKLFLLAGGLVGVFGVTAILGVTSLFFLAVSAFMYIVAHVLNCALQALGAFVHSLRLQYVEFFGLFYEGTGKPFRPFTPKREHTILKIREERI